MSPGGTRQLLTSVLCGALSCGQRRNSIRMSCLCGAPRHSANSAVLSIACPGAFRGATAPCPYRWTFAYGTPFLFELTGARRERTTCSSDVEDDGVVEQQQQQQYGPESLRAANCVKDCRRLLGARVVTPTGGETVTSFTSLAPSGRKRLILRSIPGPYGSWKSPPI
ncbi:hypothetical protein MTO96_028150 [Rhipicephalus appendiculatus]